MPKDNSSSHKHKHRHRDREHESILERAERKARKKDRKEKRSKKSKRDHVSKKKSKTSDSPTSGTKEMSLVGKHELAWTGKFNRLKEYKEKHGDCLVPSLYENDPKLGTWVRWQRTKQNKMSEDRRRRLESIGFQWHVQQDAWSDMFERLKKYKEKHGDCIVPQKYKGDPNLGRWVKTQRLRQIDMPLARQQKLEDLGFVWRAPEGKHRISSRKSGIAKVPASEEVDPSPADDLNEVEATSTSPSPPPPTSTLSSMQNEATPTPEYSSIPSAASIAPVLPQMVNMGPPSAAAFIPAHVPSAGAYLYSAIDPNHSNQNFWC
mmetsp:Transcript_7266/g.9411  ORF Transcript_7266/g.9411 Transcript_7266/m.9411 type:complete len:320 (-) Transcript_7266:270-1229(-)